MLSQEAFDDWCRGFAFSDATRDLIVGIRSSPPSRLVQSAAGNMSGRYPSRKMGVSIQFESHRDELAFIYMMENTPTVLEFYDQPEPIKLQYRSKRGRQVSVWHTPDFFVLTQNGGGWVECKMEETLLTLAETHPHRYHRNADGTWSCPPGEAYAASLGLFYRMRSSRENDWTFLRNLRFLEEYMHGPLPSLSQAVVEEVRTAVMRTPGMTLRELISLHHAGPVDDLYTLIVTGQIYVDLSQQALAEPERVQVYPDRATATSSIILAPASMRAPAPGMMLMAVGTRFLWDGKPWTILNPGETEMTLLSDDHHIRTIPMEAFDTLLRAGKIATPSTQEEGEQQAAARMLLERASHKHLEVALHRYRALGHPSDAAASARTLRRWRTRFQAAEAQYGNGYVGLLPDWNACGDRTPRLPASTEALLATAITDHYESLIQRPKRAAYLLLEQEAEQQQIPTPSYATFLRRIAQRPRAETTRRRQGTRAAAQVEPWYWELDRTTPKHGDRPWDVVHLDHTLLDIEVVSTRTGRPLGRPWATFMSDAFSRRLLVVYLTFDPPSYRSCMMVLRECVWRYGRLPQTLIVDGGPDFRSTYFETLLAYYGSTKASRPWAKPRYGSVCERLFGTANTQFVYNLTGNTQITKQVRLMTKAVDPERHAIWPLGDLYRYLTTWAYQVYDQELHPALGQCPREAFQEGVALSGERAHRKIPYDDAFRFLSLAAPRKGTALVEPGRGVKINYVYYWSEALLSHLIERTQVPVRYDPFDIGVAYAFVQGRWVQCRSEYYLQLRGHTEREGQLVSAELRKRSQNHAGEAAMTAKRLAEFLTAAHDHEGVLMQQMQDREARDVFSQMGGYAALTEERLPAAAVLSSANTATADQPGGATCWNQAGNDEDEMDPLDDYEEYR